MNSINIDIQVRKCVEEVRRYLLGTVSGRVIGINVSGDVSKEFDAVAEDILTNCLRNVLGEVTVVGEEMGVRVYGDKWLAIVDPVDGSTNHDAGIPWSSISIAIARGRHGRLRDVVYAVVSEIFRDRMYIYRDGVVEAVGVDLKRGSIPKPILLGYFDIYATYIPIERYFLARDRAVAIRSLGSAALDIVYVALGSAEVFIDIRGKLRNVDVAAALRIAQALGAKDYICGYSDSLDIPIDRIDRIKCVAVGYNEHYLKLAIDSILGERSFDQPILS